MKKIFFLILILPLQLIHAVSFDTNGNSAQVLIFPYYTVNKGFESHLSIKNNKNDYKALKIRFHESSMGIDVLGVIIYLSPHSNIKLLIFNHDGNATIKNTSGGCTVPTIPSDGISVRASIYENLNISDAREGYVEVIEMGILNNDNIKSKLLQGDCSAMWTAQNDGSLSEGGAASNNGYYGSSQPTGFLPPSGGIQGDILLLNSATEESYTIHATGVSDYSSTAQAYWSHNIDYYLLPSLASGDNKNALNITWQTTQDFGLNNTDITPRQGVASGINPYPISQLLAKTHLQTEYFVDSNLEVMTDWIITNPMRAHNIFRESSFSNEGTLTANNGDTQSLNIPLNRAVNVISLNNNSSSINPSIHSIFGSPHQNSILVEPNFNFGTIRLGIDYNFLGSHQGAPLIATAIIRNKQLVQEPVEQEQITIINTPPPINEVTLGTPVENVITKVIGEKLNIVVKPKENYIGLVKVDGVVVAEGDVNSVLRYQYTVEADATIDISYIFRESPPISQLFSHQFVELRGRDGHQGWFPLFSSPNAGDAKLQVMTSKGVDELTITLISDFENTEVVAVKGNTSASDADEWTAEFLLPSTAFKLYFKMTSELGNIVTIESDIIVPRTFSMSLLLVDGHTFSSGENNIVLSITNHSSVSESYEVLASGSGSYLVNPLITSTIDIAAGKTENLLIPILVPKEIDTHTLTVMTQVNEVSAPTFEEATLEVLVIDEPLTLSELDSKVVVNPGTCESLDRTQHAVKIAIAGSSHLDVNNIAIDTLKIIGDDVELINFELIDINTSADKPCDQQQADGKTDLLLTFNLQDILAENNNAESGSIYLSILYFTKTGMRYTHNGLLIFP